MYLETNRLLLRSFAITDAEDLQEILGDAETMRYSEPPYTFAQTCRFLTDFCMAQKGGLAAVEKESGRLIGYLLFHPLSEGIYEIGWFFNRQVWGRGYAQEACSRLMDYAFETLCAHKIVAETIDPVKSVKLMKRLGMACEGVQRRQVKDLSGNWADLHLYGILAEDWQKAKEERQQ